MPDYINTCQTCGQVSETLHGYEERFKQIKERTTAKHATKPECGGLSMKTALEIAAREGISYGKVMEKYGG